MSERLNRAAASVETIAVPPQGRALLVCGRWPECQCGDDCVDLKPADSPAARRVLFALMIAVALIGAGLIFWSFSP